MTLFRSDRRNDDGFSMIEMLVSLAVTGMAASVLAIGIERIGLGMSVANRAASQLDDIATAQFLLRQRLAVIEPVGDPQTAGKAFDFSGQTESLDFIGKVADRAAPDALQHYRLQRDSGGGLILASLSTLDATIDARSRKSDGWTSQRLLTGISRISLHYLGQNPEIAEQHAVWQDNWSHRNSLPMAILISVDFAKGDKRNWPDLVVHPRAALPQMCTRDPVTGGCASLGDSST